MSNGPAAERAPTLDRFGNLIDATVGYARGTILRGPHDECLRERHSAHLIATRAGKFGPQSLFNLTGNQSRFPLTSEDYSALDDEAVGVAQVLSRLEHLALDHVGGQAGDGVAVFNRTSAGIVACAAALASPGGVVVSVVPGVPSHPSVRHGAAAAGAELLEVSSLEVLGDTLASTVGSLVVITGVSSELAMLPVGVLVEAIAMARRAGRVVLVDDAYGARVRPLLCGQSSAREAGADLVVTSSQKAGLRGPRAGILVGTPDLVQTAKAKGMELGLEARAPSVLAVVRALERYRPAHLLGEVEAGRMLTIALAAHFSSQHVSATVLGPSIKEDDVLAILLARSGHAAARPTVVPAEAAAALGMLLLEHHGILTVSAIGMPGARVSLRLKATEEVIERFGGAEAVADALVQCIDRLGAVIDQPDTLRMLILGDRGR